MLKNRKQLLKSLKINFHLYTRFASINTNQVDEINRLKERVIHLESLVQARVETGGRSQEDPTVAPRVYKEYKNKNKLHISRPPIRIRLGSPPGPGIRNEVISEVGSSSTAPTNDNIIAQSGSDEP